MANRSMPEHAVPFPQFLDQVNCLDSHSSNTEDDFSTRSSATKLMNQQSGHPTAAAAARPHSLRWLHVLAHGQDSTPLRSPSIASAASYTSSLHHPDDTCSIRGKHPPGSEYEMVISPGGYRGHRMLEVPYLSETQRSAHRYVAPSFSRKRSTDLSSLNSAASFSSFPVTPNTPFFASNPAIADFRESPFPDVGPYCNLVRRNLPDGNNMKDEETLAHFRRKSQDQRLEREPTFYPNVDLSLQQLQYARDLDVFDHEAKRVRFGNLWRDQPTCVIFIRHFWSVMIFVSCW